MKHRILLFLLLLALPLSVIAQGDITVPTKKTEQKSEPKKKPIPKLTTGTLVITSSPSGAVVKIDGDYMGETPLTLRQQKAGSYSITFSAEGYISSTQSAIVTAGKTITCSATLKKKQATQPVTTTTTTQPTKYTSPLQMITANGVSFKMIRVDGLDSPFYIGATEVTQELWQAVMGNNPSRFKGSDRPVENVSWDDCKNFISKLNSLTGKSFRLPKEKEWEYAAKGGNMSRGYEYSGSNTIDDVAWYWKNSGDSYLSGTDDDWDLDKIQSNNSCTHPVARKKANELGLYDMSGNVCEWCEDLYDSSGSNRVRRGGGWLDYAAGCPVSFRYHDAPSSRYDCLGLRLAL